MAEPITIWTIGHSTRSLADFQALLTANGIQAVADVRRFPSSRKFPHFNQPALSRSLADAGIEYVHLPELGGRRHARKDSPNTACAISPSGATQTIWPRMSFARGWTSS